MDEELKEAVYEVLARLQERHTKTYYTDKPSTDLQAAAQKLSKIFRQQAVEADADADDCPMCGAELLTGGFEYACGRKRTS